MAGSFGLLSIPTAKFLCCYFPKRSRRRRVKFPQWSAELGASCLQLGIFSHTTWAHCNNAKSIILLQQQQQHKQQQYYRATCYWGVCVRVAIEQRKQASVALSGALASNGPMNGKSTNQQHCKQKALAICGWQWQHLENSSNATLTLQLQLLAEYTHCCQ